MNNSVSHQRPANKQRVGRPTIGPSATSMPTSGNINTILKDILHIQGYFHDIRSTKKRRKLVFRNVKYIRL